MSFQQRKVGAPKRSGLDPLSSNKESPHFSPKSLTPLPAPCVLNFPGVHLPGWDQGAAHRTLGATEVLSLTPFVGFCGHFFQLCPTQGLDLPRVWVFSDVF